MRIGIDASCLPPHIAGAGRYICGLISGLNDEDDRNEYVLFVKQRDGKLFPNLNGNFDVVELPNHSRPARIIWQLRSARFEIERLKLDVWHSPHYTLLASPTRAHSIVTFHDMTFYLMPELYSLSKRLFFQRMIRHAVQQADRIVAVSESTANDVRAIFGDRLCGKLTTVHSGIHDRFRPIENDNQVTKLRKNLGLSEEFVLFVGTLDRRKNLSTLIEAFARLRRQGINMQLLLVGQPSQGTTEIAATIKRLDLEHYVKIAGFLPDAVLPALYSAARLVVYPSLYEGFGFPVLEAMACGTPVLTSDTSATREISGWSEIQAAPTDVSQWAHKMARALTDEPFRKKMMEYGIERAKDFSWRKTAREMIEIYEISQDRGSTYTKHAIHPNGSEMDPPANRAIVGMPGKLRQLPILPQAVLQTLAYSDLFGYPLRSDEILRNLVGEAASLTELCQTLNDLMQEHYIEFHEGHYFLRGRENLVKGRRFREEASVTLLNKHRRLLQFVCHFPFVEAVALSGAIAFKNSMPDDDIDLFILTRHGRTWMVYFFLSAFMKILGKRRLICLNYLYAKPELQLQEKDFFVAHQIANLRLLAGNGLYESFLKNNSWVLEFLPQTVLSHVHANNNEFHDYSKRLSSTLGSRLKRTTERFFGLKVFDILEKFIYATYGGHVRKITSHLNGSVQVEPDQIKLFTNDHRQKTMRKFRDRLVRLGNRPHVE